MCFKHEVLKHLERIEDKIDRLLQRGVPACGVLLLPGLPVIWETPTVAKKMIAIPTFTWGQLQTEGAMLQLWDKDDNPATLPAPGTYTIAWTSDDPTILTIAQDPANPAGAVVSKVGPAKLHVKLDGVITSTAPTPPAFVGPIDCACFVDVPSGPPTQGSLVLAP
jgi:hypothetical protein